MNRWFIWSARLALLIILAMAATAVAGWLSQNVRLVQIRPNYEFMQYNTALCIAFCAAAALALLSEHYRFTRTAVALVLVIDGLTLLQYLFGIDLGINGMLLPIAATQVLPVSIGLNTAIALLLTAGSLLACTRPIFSARQAMAIAITASLIFALGAVPLLGYISGIQEAYHFGTFTRMSLPSSCAFVLFGTILTFYAGMRSRTLYRWVPLPVFLALITVAFASSIAVRLHERQQIEQALQQRVDEQAANYTGHLKDLYSALNRIGLRWEVAGRTPYPLWKSDTESYRNDLPFLVGVSWLDKDGRLQAISPLEGNEKLIGFKLSEDPERAQAIHEAMQTNTPRVTPPIQFFNHHGLGYLYIRPLTVNGKFDGMMISAVRLSTLMSNFSENTLERDYFYTLDHDGTTVLSTLPPDMSPTTRWKASASFDNLNEHYRLTLYPRPAFLASQRSLLPFAVLGAGVLMSILVALSILLMLRERWQARLLRNSEETFRLAMSYSPIGMALVSLQGRWLEVNATLCELLGYKRAELLATDFQTLTHPDDLEADLELVQQVIDGKIKSYALEKRYFRKDGSEVKILLSVSMVRNDDGSPKYFISMIQDISEREKLIAQLQQTNSDLEQFAYVASHDLQEPLRMVTSFVGLLGLKYSDKLTAEGREFVTIAVDAAKRMQALINDLLEYARLGRETQVLVPIDCNKEMQHVRMNLATLIESTGATLGLGPLPTIRGNPVEFLRLMQNLIGNGIKFNRPGVAPAIRVTAEQQDAMWVFRVADNGIGLKQEYFERIFQPFKRLHTQEEYHGSGIGLAVCRKIVENLGGRIWIESVVGEGSTFLFTVPVATKEDA